MLHDPRSQLLHAAKASCILRIDIGFSYLKDNPIYPQKDKQFWKLAHDQVLAGLASSHSREDKANWERAWFALLRLQPANGLIDSSTVQQPPGTQFSKRDDGIACQKPSKQTKGTAKTADFEFQASAFKENGRVPRCSVLLRLLLPLFWLWHLLGRQGCQFAVRKSKYLDLNIRFYKSSQASWKNTRDEKNPKSGHVSWQQYSERERYKA